MDGMMNIIITTIKMVNHKTHPVIKMTNLKELYYSLNTNNMIRMITMISCMEVAGNSHMVIMTRNNKRYNIPANIKKHYKP